jgi:hypothetical protein
MIPTLTKYTWEEFSISGDFRKAPAGVGEAVDKDTSSIVAVDANNVDATSDLLDTATKAAAGTRLSVKCRNGDPSKSPYLVSFKMVTTLGNKYQTRLEIIVEE